MPNEIQQEKFVIILEKFALYHEEIDCHFKNMVLI